MGIKIARCFFNSRRLVCPRCVQRCVPTMRRLIAIGSTIIALSAGGGVRVGLATKSPVAGLAVEESGCILNSGCLLNLG